MFLASLRLRLALLVGLGLLPALGILIWFAGQHRAVLGAAVRADAQRTAHVAAELSDRSLEQARGVLDGIVQIAELRDAPPEVCTAILGRVLHESDDYVDFGVVLPDGQVRCSAIPGPDRLSLREHAYLREAMEKRTFVPGGYQGGDRPTLRVARPLAGGDGRIEGAVYAAIDVAALARRTAGARPDGRAFVTVTDRSGVILARTPPAPGWVGVRLDAHWPDLDLAAEGGEVVDDAPVDGEPYLLAHATLGPPGGAAAHVYVGIPRVDAFSPVDQMLQRVFVGVFGTTLLVLVLVWVAGDLLLVRRVEALVVAAERLGGGDLAARAGLAHGDDEFGRLAAAFDQMASNIDRLTALHRQMIEGAGEAICSLTPNGRISSANPAAARLVGLRPDQLVGANAHALFHGYDEEGGHPDADCPLRAPGRDGEERRADDWFKRAGGPKFPVKWVASPLRDDGRLVGSALIFDDESERRRLEEQLRRAARMEAVGQLADGVAHDFNNLLTAILGYTDLLKVHLSPEDRAWRDADEILHAAQRAAALTRQLLSFSRRREVQVKVLELNGVVQNLDRMLRRLVGEHIEVRIDLDEDVGCVRADAGELEQVLLNLAVNARDAMHAGGTLTIATRCEAPPEAGGPAGHGWVMMEVADTGHGIPEEIRRRIFEPFYSTKEKGTGLGLATVLRVVREAGGVLTCDSNQGQGTTFRVYLPQSSEEVRPVAQTPVANTPVVGSETVLVVEDEPTVRAMARRTLEMCGYTVIESTDVPDAIELAERHEGPIHLLLSDMVMPGMNGAELADRVRRGRPEMRILFMSGYDGAGAGPAPEVDAPWLPKPFTPTQLARRVREVLDGVEERPTAE